MVADWRKKLLFLLLSWRGVSFAMVETVTREQAHELVETLPLKFSWDDLMRLIYERIAIERGLADIKAGRVTEVGALRKEFGLPR